MNEVIGYVDTRAAEVATAAIASDVAQVHQDKLDADADAQAAAASAAAAAGTLANAVKKTGEASQSIAGDIAVSGNLSGGKVTVPAPVNNTDAANKKYVDDADALKADKTYVDAQDATKISITDINSYAVGLTGNQTKTGALTFRTYPIVKAAIARDEAVTTVTAFGGMIVTDVNNLEVARVNVYRDSTANILELQIKSSEGTLGYFRLNARDDGIMRISTNMAKPTNW